ncbi:MAG TPA: 3-hydroxyacyl-CoA dehydrogenase/enoyl-CoA hydratase family protein [Gemmatimonadaceae bacterium]
MRIAKVGVIGAGAMGTGIAALAASAGFPVVLLDVPDAGDRDARAKGAIDRALSSRPPAFLDPSCAVRIDPGNTEDDLEQLRDCDWIVEAIVERPGPKRDLFARLEPLLGPHAIVTSNTSGIPIHTLSAGLGERFRQHFLGTHFFNPVRHLHLLELIPTSDTLPDVVTRIRDVAERNLGKGVILAKDVPGFIANRLGLYGMFRTIRLMEDFGLTIDEVDALTGPFLGRPRSATFRTADISGLDVLLDVSAGLSATTGEDFSLPSWIHDLVRQGRLGVKTGAGFYRKEGSQIFTLDWRTGEYRPQATVPLAELAHLQREPLDKRLKGITRAGGTHAEFLRALLLDTAAYTLSRTPDVAYDITSVDRALEWGFAWEQGPFAMFDALGVDWLRAAFAERKMPEPQLLATAREGFYRQLGSGPRQLSFHGEYAPIEPIPDSLDLDLIHRRLGALASNRSATLLDIGDGVALLKLHGKMNTLGNEALDLIERSLDIVNHSGFAGLVIGSANPNTFSAGANLVELLAQVDAGNWDALDTAVRRFQASVASLRTVPFPVVVAANGLTLGGGAEYALHAARIQAGSELYIGLVEVGVGLLPAGGGTRQLLFRFTGELEPYEEADPFEAVKRAFKLISMGTMSASALDARRLGFLRAGDRITMNRDRVLSEAKARVLELAPDYTPPLPKTVRALGREGLGNLSYGIWAMREAGYITDHEVTIGRKIAYVLCGGDGPPRTVSEQDILDLEREAFLSLLGTPETRARIAYMLENGKPLRN